jgi:hypothetical protein
MRRTVHPQQDLDRLDLLNAELRWFYTMHLQSMCRYIEVLKRLADHREELQYAVESLLYYARWMERFEKPTLDASERLQYPNETWAAQDMRKWHVLAYASRWAESDEEYSKLMAKAEFFYHHSLKTLNGFASKSLCRPLVLLLNFGWQRESLLKEPRIERSWKKVTWPSIVPFVPQRQIAISRAKRMLIALLFSVSLLVVAAIGWIIWAVFRSG